ncbi:CPBP family glutamic-type intramembrane protease [Microbacterium paulum]
MALAPGIAAAYLVTAVLTAPGWRPVFSALPTWAGTLADAVVTLGPLLAAALLAARLAGPRIARALGLRVRPVDLLLGALGALVARALVEVIAPTTGSLRPALAGGTADATAAVAAAIVALVVLAPVAEELFFRGTVQRALEQLLGGVSGGSSGGSSGGVSGGASSRVAAVVSIVLTTVAFVVLHALPYGADVPIAVVLPPLVVGLGAGALTAVTGRIAGGVVLHVLFNLAGVLLLLR